MRYVSVAEAEAVYGFDAHAENVSEPVSTEPVITPLVSWWGATGMDKPITRT